VNELYLLLDACYDPTDTVDIGLRINRCVAKHRTMMDEFDYECFQYDLYLLILDTELEIVLN
jgi:hypothetical protein